MSSGAELQKLIYDTLMGDPAIRAIAYKVYDRVPASPFGPVLPNGSTEKTAYISIGASDSNEDDAECIDGLEINQTLHIWSRAVGQVEAKRLTDLVRKKLHRANLSLTENSLVLLYVDSHRVFPDSDPLTTHGVVQVRAAVEEP